MANANLFAQFAKPAKSFMDYTAEMDRADLRKQEIQQNAFAAAGQRQKLERGNALQNLFQQNGTLARPELINKLRGGGYAPEADAMEASGIEMDSKRATTAKVTQETSASEAKMFREGIGLIASNPTPETLQAVLGHLEKTTGKPQGYGMQFFAGADTPELIRERAMKIGIELEKQMPKAGTQNQGGYNLNTSTDPITGVVTEMGRNDITQTADNAATQVTSAANNAASQATSIANNTANNARQAADSAAGRSVIKRGQDMTDARTRERMTFDQGTAIAEAGGPSQAEFTKQFGKAEAGHRWKPDGSSERIPGGSKDIKAGELVVKAQKRAEGAMESAKNVRQEIKEATALAGYWTTGVGGLLSNLPATPARDLQAKLTSIKANIGFDRLQQMRHDSPTGGALGQVAVQELVALQSTIASLDQLQSPPELRAALGKINRHYMRWAETMAQSASGKGGAQGSWGGPAAALNSVQAYSDADKERRFQEYKAKQK